jgi:hypothetical protein
MKGLVSAIAIVVLSLALVAGVVFGLGDDEIFVSPPEVVAEEFVRALALGRVEPARAMLARGAEPWTSGETMREASASLRSRFGRVDDVDATVTERTRDTAVVRVRVDGERQDADFRLSVIRESGAWSVAGATGLRDVVNPTRAGR